MSDTTNLLSVAKQGRDFWLTQRQHNLYTAFHNSSQQGQTAAHLCELLQVWNQTYASERSLYSFFDKIAHPFLRSITEEQLEVLLTESLSNGKLIEHAEILSQWPTRHRLTKALRSNLTVLAGVAQAPPTSSSLTNEREDIFRIIDFLGVCEFQPSDFQNFLDRLDTRTLLNLFTNLPRLKHFANYQHRLASALPMAGLSVVQAFASSLQLGGEGRHSVIIENCLVPIKEPRYPEPLYPSITEVDRWIFRIAGLCENERADLARLLRSYHRSQRHHEFDIEDLFYKYLRTTPSNHEDVLELFSFHSDLNPRRMGSLIPYPQHPTVVVSMSGSMRRGSLHHKDAEGDFRVSDPIDFNRDAVLGKLSAEELIDLIKSQGDAEFAVDYINQVFYSGNPNTKEVLNKLAEDLAWSSSIEGLIGTKAVVVISKLDRISLEDDRIRKLCLRVLSFAASTIKPEHLQHLLGELFLRHFFDEVDENVEIRQEKHAAIRSVSEAIVKNFRECNEVAEAVKWLGVNEELPPAFAPTRELIDIIVHTRKEWIEPIDECDSATIAAFLHHLCLLLGSSSTVKLYFLIQLLSNLTANDLEKTYLCNAYFDPDESRSWLDCRMRIQMKIILWRMIYSLDPSRAHSLLINNVKADVILFIFAGVRPPDGWCPVDHVLPILWLDIIRENSPTLLGVYLGSLLKNANSDPHNSSALPLLRLAGAFVKWYCDLHKEIELDSLYDILEGRILALESSDYRSAVEFAFVRLSDDERHTIYIEKALDALYVRVKDLHVIPHEVHHLVQHLNISSPGAAEKLLTGKLPIS